MDAAPLHNRPSTAPTVAGGKSTKLEFRQSLMCSNASTNVSDGGGMEVGGSSKDGRESARERFNSSKLIRRSLSPGVCVLLHSFFSDTVYLAAKEKMKHDALK